MFTLSAPSVFELSMQLLVQTATEAVAIFDADLCYLQVNAAYAALNGVTIADCSRQPFSSFNQSPLLALLQPMQQVLAGQLNQSRLVLATTAHGPCCCELYLLQTEHQPKGLLLRIRQLDQPQQDKQDCELLRQVLDSLFTFVGILTPEGVLVDANRSPLDADKSE